LFLQIPAIFLFYASDRQGNLIVFDIFEKYVLIVAKFYEISPSSPKRVRGQSVSSVPCIKLNASTKHKMPIEIKDRYSGRVLFASEEKTLKNALEEAVVLGVDLSCADLRNADLGGACLAGVNLSNADFSGASLFKTALCRSSLTGARFRNVDLRYADIRYANLKKAVLKNSVLSFVNFSWANLTKADFQASDLEGTDV